MKIQTNIVLLIYLILLLLAHFISFSSDISLNRVQVGSIRLDHLLHVLVFLPLPLLINKLLKFRYTVLFSLLLAISYESIHFILPYRTFTLVDLFSNLIGVFGGIIFIFLRKKFNKK